MTYLVRTINGDTYPIDDRTRAGVARVLLAPREDRPAFIEFKAIGAIIATASITSVTKETASRTKERLPTIDEDEAMFNQQWDERHKP